MTKKQFWMKADQIADSKKTMDEKAEQMASLLKSAYDENLPAVILYEEGADGKQSQVYMNLDDEHPNTIGNRVMMFYSSPHKAESDLRAKAMNKLWGEASAKDTLNNIMLKDAVGFIIFNCHTQNNCVMVSKTVLKQYIPEPYDIPEGFTDVPVSGYPEIKQ